MTAKVQQIPIEDILHPNVPPSRANVEKLEADIQREGLIEPLRVWRFGNKWHVASGRRRFLAIRHLRRMAATVYDRENDKEVSAAELYANVPCEVV